MRSRRRAGGDGRGSPGGTSASPAQASSPVHVRLGAYSRRSRGFGAGRAALSRLGPQNFAVDGWVVRWQEHSVCFLVPSLMGSFSETKTDLGLAQTLSGVGGLTEWPPGPFPCKRRSHPQESHCSEARDPSITPHRLSVRPGST